MTSRARYRWFLGCAALLAACSAEGVSPVVNNSMLQKWCGTHPCQWTTRGNTARVGTWHPDDYAIELLSDDAAVTQVNTDINESQSDCFSFSLTADISAGTLVYLELDFLDDGVIDFQLPLPALHWERKTFDITPPTWYQGVRFIVRRQGPGHAIVAQLEVENADGTCTAPAIELSDRPAGATCKIDDECEVHRCVGGICGGTCTDNRACSADEVCGEVLGRERYIHSCTPLASLPLGAVCSLDEQCQTAHCIEGLCSECRPPSQCADGSACARPALVLPPDLGVRGVPYQCNPGQHLRLTGEPCTVGADCESDSCDGARTSCAYHDCSNPPAGCSTRCIQTLVTPGMCR